MPNKTAIEWTDYTSNPIAPVGGGWGCSKVSPGCDHCYAERLNKWRGNKRDFRGRWQFRLNEKELDGLIKLNSTSDAGGSPIKVFLGDMTDIFHGDVPFGMLHELFAVLDNLDRLILQTLTKRVGRMAYFANHVLGGSWPENVWAGTSVESAKYLPRLTVLASVPAKVRICSFEPLLEDLDVRPWLTGKWWHCKFCDRAYREGDGCDHGLVSSDGVRMAEGMLDWGIYGGESGPGARPMHPDSARLCSTQV